MSTLNTTFKNVYLYIVSIVGLVTVVVGTVSFLNLGITRLLGVTTPQWSTSPEVTCQDRYAGNYPSIPMDANGALSRQPTEEEVTACIEKQTKQQQDQYENETKRTLAWSLAAMLVGFPIWLYHWGIVRKQK